MSRVCGVCGQNVWQDVAFQESMQLLKVPQTLMGRLITLQYATDMLWYDL